MKVLDYDINIAPKTLEEWDNLSNLKIEQALEDILTTPREFGPNISLGFSVSSRRFWGDPIPKHLLAFLEVLDRTRFQENLTLSHAITYLRSQGIDIRTTQSLNHNLDKYEEWLGILPELSKTALSKCKTPREVRENRRKRRVLERTKRKQRELREERNRIEQLLASTTTKKLKQGKGLNLTAKEIIQEESLEEKITRLKTESKESRFQETEVPQDAVVLFKPTPKQAEFLAAPEKVVFYGGAAGGGKSYALIMDAIRYAHRPAMRSLIIRRRNSELKELISVSKQLYPKAFPGAKFNSSKMIWTFPSGATLEFGYFEKEDDKERYIGLPYSYIAWDEIQLQKSPEGFDFLFSRLRTTDPEINCYVRCTGNPGGAPWVKQRFIDPAPYNTTFLRCVDGDVENGITYKFIPATLYDNPYLTQDGEYEKTLKQLPDAQVQQLLYGDWDTVDDSFFNFDKKLHVTQELPPMHWPIICAMDYGWVDPASTIWAKIDPSSGALYIYRELEMQRATVEQWADKMFEMEASEQYVRVADRVIDGSLFKETGHTGPGHLETLSKRRLYPRPADRRREPGWEQVNQRLLPGANGKPSLFVHESCKKVIDQLMTAQSKENNPNDIDESRMFSHGRKHHWDLLDCVRYLCMARPKAVTHDTILQNAKSSKAWEQYNSYFS